jgi:hypothetical protein
MTKQETLLKNLKAGKEFTAKQIKAFFGLANPAAAIRTLREQGYCVYSNAATVSGTAVVKYRIGTATRKMVALANAVGGANVFTRTA